MLVSARAAFCGVLLFASVALPGRAAAATNPSQERFDATLTNWQVGIKRNAGIKLSSIPAGVEGRYVHVDHEAMIASLCATLQPTGYPNERFVPYEGAITPARPNQTVYNIVCGHYSSPTDSFANPYVVGTVYRTWVCPAGHNQTFNHRYDGIGDYIDGCTPPAVVPGKDLGECRECNGTNPVNQTTGNKVERETDYVGAGPFPLRLERFYNSQGGFQVDFYFADLPPRLGTPPNDVEATYRVAPWHTPKLKTGRKWRHSYERAITSLSGGEVPTLVMAHRADGKSYAYRKDGVAWTGDPDVELRLEADLTAGGQALGWRLIDEDDTVEHYDAQGRLTRIVKRGGLSQTLAYDADGYLAAVADDFGRQLTFVRDADNYLVRVIDPAGRAIEYGRDEVGKLISVTLPGGATRQYKYEHPTWVDALTEIVDETGNWFARFTYATNSSRAIRTEHNGGAQAVTLSYPSSTTATLTDAHGRTQTYTHGTFHGVRRLTAITGGPCGDCGPQAATTTYDANGRVATRTDFNGVRTDTTYDARGLLTTQVEAANVAALKRTTATQWHPTFRVPTLRTEPGRTTAWAYDAQGNRIEETVTDTATGTSRTTRWTWGPTGLLLSTDGPREDVDDVTEYRYDAQGNLIEVENALGQVTRITAHDAHGNPLTVIDPNDSLSTLVYDERLRLVSRTVAGAETRFEYLPNGLLSKVMSPDGSFVRYHHDAAHRVIGVEDALGNRIDYVLDGFGNRIDEQVKDPSGVLQRRVQRAYDTFNRLAQLIGQAGTTAYTYDTEGQRLTSTDALSRVTTNAYDALRRLKQTTDPASGITAYSYDARQPHQGH